MELTGSLKQSVEAAKTIEEKKSVIAEAGVLLTDEELTSIAGGLGGLEVSPCSNEGENIYLKGGEQDIILKGGEQDIIL